MERQSKGRQKDISQMKQKDSFVWTEKTTLRGIVLLLALSLYPSTGSIHMWDYHRIIIIKYNALECNMSHHWLHTIVQIHGCALGICDLPLKHIISIFNIQSRQSLALTGGCLPLYKVGRLQWWTFCGWSFLPGWRQNTPQERNRRCTRGNELNVGRGANNEDRGRLQIFQNLTGKSRYC